MKILKSKDAWFEVILVDPITLILSKFLIKLKTNPILLTFIAFFLRILAGILFLFSHFIFGAILAYLGILFDGMDGKVARGLKKFTLKQGTLDFILDQMAFAFILLCFALNFMFLNINLLNLLIVFLWLLFYYVLMSLTSTKHRLFVEKRIKSMNLKEHRKYYDKVLNESKKPLKIIKHVYIKLENLFGKFRMIPFPSTIEAEFFIFIFAPLFFNYFWVMGLIGVLCFIPDILSHIYTCYLLTKNEQKY